MRHLGWVGVHGFTGGGLRRAWPALVSVAIIGAVLVAAATAGVVTPRESATLTAPHLSVHERRAITITSISAVADPSLGLLVTATFNGDIERYLGQGGLTHGLVALVLVPKSSSATPPGLTDEAGGFTPTGMPILTRSGRRLTLAPATIDLYSPELVVHTATPPPATVVRQGDQVLFHIPASELGQITRVKLKVLANGPVAGAPPAQRWHAILAARPTDLASLRVDFSKLGCAQLSAARSGVAHMVSTGLDPELGRQEQVRAHLRAAIAGYSAFAHLATPPRISAPTLAAYLSRTSARIGRLQSEMAALDGLSNRLNASVKACSTPPAEKPPAANTQPTSTTTTTAPPPTALTPPAVQVVQTDSGLSQYMASQPGLAMSTTQPQGVPVIELNDQMRYQQFAGLGAAMTDSSASLIGNDMSSSQRAALMQDLFGAPSSGRGLPAPPIHLNFLRVGIGATGAMTTTSAYSYDDNPPGGSDPNLTSFSINHDKAYIIPTVQQALAINPGLQILANPWSPPAWMKSNNSLGDTNASGSLLSADYPTYADYFVKFIQEYQANGIPIDAITPANEPTSGSGGTAYPGLNFPESNEAQFIAQNLKPALSAAGLHPKIYGNDLSWDQHTKYAQPLASDPNAGPDLTGISWHCYFGTPTVMSQLQQNDPGLDQIVDECSPEIRGFGAPEFLISTLRNWASTVAIWSVALDPNGQPIQTPNDCGGCRGVVSINQQTGAVTFRTEYYQLGQVSTFVQPGATRIDSPNFVTYGTNSSNIETVTSGLDDVAFINPDGSKVLVANNNSNAAISFAVQSDGSYFTYTIPAQAMSTFVWH